MPHLPAGQVAHPGDQPPSRITRKQPRLPRSGELAGPVGPGRQARGTRSRKIAPGSGRRAAPRKPMRHVGRCVIRSEPPRTRAGRRPTSLLGYSFGALLPLLRVCADLWSRPAWSPIGRSLARHAAAAGYWQAGPGL